jgi:aminopeptidase N
VLFRSFIQKVPDTPGQKDKKPMMIPATVALIGKEGAPVCLSKDGGGTESCLEKTLVLSKDRETFTFSNVPDKPVPSLFRSFSAPVIIDAGYSPSELTFLMANDTDAFNRWDAAQVLVTDTITGLVAMKKLGNPLVLENGLIKAFEKTLLDRNADKALIAQILSIPTETELGDRMDSIDVEAIHETRDFLMMTLAVKLKETFRAVFSENMEKGHYAIDPASIARRKLKNVALSYLALSEDDPGEFVFREFSSATNMTDKLAALTYLSDMDHSLSGEAVNMFYDTWKKDTLVLDKWFAVQAASRRSDTLDTVVKLCSHPDFSMKNPNKVRSLIGTFAQANPMAFHEPTGKGYTFLADRVIMLDKINASIAARMVSAFNKWRRYDKDRQDLMQKELERILASDRLSKGVYEVVSKTLEV